MVLERSRRRLFEETVESFDEVDEDGRVERVPEEGRYLLWGRVLDISELCGWDVLIG